MSGKTEKSRVITVDQSGRRREVIEWQRWTSFQPTKGPSQRLPGGTELTTDNGLHVNRNDDGTYTIFDTDEVLKPIEAQA